MNYTDRAMVTRERSEPEPGYTDDDGRYHPPESGPLVVAEAEVDAQTSGEARARGSTGMPSKEIEGTIFWPEDDERFLDIEPEDDIEIFMDRFRRHFTGKIQFVSTDDWTLKVRYV